MTKKTPAPSRPGAGAMLSSAHEKGRAEYGGEVEHLGRCELNTFVAVN